MTYIYGISVVMLVISVLLAIWRAVIGPSNVDRILASDVIVATVVGGVGLMIVIAGRPSALPILLALSLAGFSGAVSVARFLVDRRGRER